MHFLLHALLHSLKLLPFLFLAYILIEIIEYYSATKMQQSKLLTGKYSTLFGAGFGLIPQCGFSVVATDLYASKKLRVGTLLAVYIATSDEAIPLLIMNPTKAINLLPLLLVKFILAIIIGYTTDFIIAKINNKKQTVNLNQYKNDNEHIQNHSQEEHYHNNEHDDEEHNQHKGCCGHTIEHNNKKEKLKQFLLHPFIHSLKIFAFILIINIAFGGLIELIGGEAKLIKILDTGKWFTPLLSCLIGLIPNCASSVVITELFIKEGISLGACIGGLIANAGIGFVVLFKENKNLKQNLLILSCMFLIGVITGYVIQLIGF